MYKWILDSLFKTIINKQLRQEKNMIDLHAHSSASDGTLSPGELIALAARQNLTAVALTDHDTVSGLEEFIAAARETTVYPVPGVEISAFYNNREIHLAGLFIDSHNQNLLELLKQMRIDREERNNVILNKLRSLGYHISEEEILEEAGGECVGRPHFAGALMKKYDFESRQDVFDQCLKRGTPGYSPRKLPPPDKVIEVIHEAGGLAVWCHPIYRTKGERSFVRKMLKLLVPMGLDAIEAYYSIFSTQQTQMLLTMAQEFGIAVSGGSDFHGDNQPHIKLGSGDGNMEIPDDVFFSLAKLADKCLL